MWCKYDHQRWSCGQHVINIHDLVTSNECLVQINVLSCDKHMITMYYHVTSNVCPMQINVLSCDKHMITMYYHVTSNVCPMQVCVLSCDKHMITIHYHVTSNVCPMQINVLSCSIIGTGVLRDRAEAQKITIFLGPSRISWSIAKFCDFTKNTIFQCWF